MKNYRIIATTPAGFEFIFNRFEATSRENAIARTEASQVFERDFFILRLEQDLDPK